MKEKFMSIDSMKAVRLHQYGGPNVLRYEDAPMPVLKPGELLVRVHAAGINPPDWYLRDGYSTLPADWRPPVPFPAIPGSDLSGVVEAIGQGVQGFAVGDAVFGMVRFPSFGASAAYAEYVAAPASDFAHKPAGIDHATAAAAPMALLTAWQFLVELGHEHANPFQPVPHRPVALEGSRVLVNGAAGGVGHLALQLAKWKGAHVIAVASGAHASFLHGIGADEFIDYTKVKPEETVRNVDVVLDTVGGPATGRFLHVLNRGGALYPVYPLGFSDPEAAAKAGVTVSATQVRSNGKQLEEAARLIATGLIRVAIDSTFPLADANRAHERAARGHIRGKIVLMVREDV
jgi:NADPH:quinone reductase-like Zn-dependent oxidoreductase